jgi:hypothetical protein
MGEIYNTDSIIFNNLLIKGQLTLNINEDESLSCFFIKYIYDKYIYRNGYFR